MQPAHPYSVYDGRGPEPAHMPQLSHLNPFGPNLGPPPEVVYPHHHHHHHAHHGYPPPPPHMIPPLGHNHMVGGMQPFLLQPSHHVARPGYPEEYLRIMEQRRTMENHRGATKMCIEMNTFPHKFKKVQRGKGHEDEEDEEVDKCTICLCGK